MDTLSDAPGGPEGSTGNPAGGSARDIIFLPWRKLRDGGARGSLLFVSCLLLICGTAAFIGAVPTRIFGHDNFFLLGNGWRIYCGQRPHVDFYSPWGPVTFLIVSLGFALSNASPNALGYGSAIFGLLTGLWAYWLGRGRLEAAPRSLFGLYVALLATAPYALGTWPTWSTHAMVYNRYGFALVALVLAECLQRSEGSPEHAGEFVSGVSTGAAMALALFLKASYFFVTLPIAGVSLAFRRPITRRLCGLAAGFVVVALALLAYLRFDILKVFQDMRMAASTRPMEELNSRGLVDKLVRQVPTLMILIILFIYGSNPQQRGRRRLEDYRLLIWGLVIYGADVMLMFSNMQPRGMPLVGALGIVVASWALVERHQAVREESHQQKQRAIFVLLLCGVLSLPQMCLDFASLIYGARQKAHPSAEYGQVRFSTPRLAALILYDWPPNDLVNGTIPDQRGNGRVYTARVNEGIALLKRHCGPGDRVLNMDMANPFPYALEWRPPRGGMASINSSSLLHSPNEFLSKELRPPDEEYFRDASAVMVPKQPALDPEPYDHFYRAYQPGLLERYRLTAESESWWLYKPK